MNAASFVCFFFIKQKTAYEMRISDWSSDVCSSDLRPASGRPWSKGQPHERHPLEPVARATRRQRLRYEDARQAHGRAGMNIAGKRVLNTGGSRDRTRVV